MWNIEFLDNKVFAEMEKQPNEIKARFEHIARLISVNGLERVNRPHIAHLSGKLWEIRMNGKNTIVRAIYVVAKEKRVVVVRVFTKKSRKTPHREIEIALERSREAFA